MIQIRPRRVGRVGRWDEGGPKRRGGPCGPHLPGDAKLARLGVTHPYGLARQGSFGASRSRPEAVVHTRRVRLSTRPGLVCLLPTPLRACEGLYLPARRVAATAWDRRAGSYLR